MKLLLAIPLVAFAIIMAGTLAQPIAQRWEDKNAYQRQLARELEQGRDPNAENPRVSDWVQTWIAGKRKLAASTLTRYRQLLKWQIEPRRIGMWRGRRGSNPQPTV